MAKKIMYKIVRKIRCCFCNVEHPASCFTVEYNWVFVFKIITQLPCRAEFTKQERKRLFENLQKNQQGGFKATSRGVAMKQK